MLCSISFLRRGVSGRDSKEWFEKLDPVAAKVAMALTRMEQGNLSNVKGVGGGTKRDQQKDIDAALLCWADYKHRKKQENNDAIDA